MKKWYKKKRESKVKRYYLVSDDAGFVLMAACGRFYSIEEAMNYTRSIYKYRVPTTITISRMDDSVVANCLF